MPALIAAENANKALVAGMSWSMLNAKGRARGTEIRTLARDAEANHVLVMHASGPPARSAVGLLAGEELDIDEFGPLRKKRLHSLAAAFAKMSGEGFALLAYAVDAPSDSSSDDHVAVVVCEAGLPQADDIKTALDALAVVANYAQGQTGFTYTVYTNDAELFPEAILITDEQLWACVDRGTQLGQVPLDLYKIAGAGLLATAVVAGVVMWQQHVEQQRRAELQRRAVLEDPVPRYRQALAPLLGSLGMPREQAVELLTLIGRYPIYVEGWVLTQVECGAGLKGCESTWQRAGGTTEGLLAARQAVGERLLEDGRAGARSTSDKVRMRREMSIRSAGVSSREELLPNDQTRLPAASYAQRLDNAGVQLRVDASGYALWPRVPGLSAGSLPASQTVQAMSVEITTDAVLAHSIIDSLPAWIWINGLKVDIDVNEQPPKTQLVLRGTSYVR